MRNGGIRTAVVAIATTVVVVGTASSVPAYPGGYPTGYETSRRVG